MINKKTLSDLLASGIDFCPEGDMYCKFHLNALCFFKDSEGRPIDTHRNFFPDPTEILESKCPHKKIIKKGEKDGFTKLYTSYGDFTTE